jgi:hypothetical protein
MFFVISCDSSIEDEQDQQIDILNTEEPVDSNLGCLNDCTIEEYDSCNNCEFDVCLRERLDCRFECGQDIQTITLNTVYNCVMNSTSIEKRNNCIVSYCTEAVEQPKNDKLIYAYYRYFCMENRFF